MKHLASFIVRSGFALVALVLAGCTTAPSPVRLDEVNPILDAGSIVFLGPDANLYVIASDRSEPIQLTTGAHPQRRVYSAYAWAGDRVVYIEQERTLEDGLSSTLYAVRPGSRPSRIWRDDGVAPFFLYPSPDGERIGYLGGTTGASGFRMESVDLSSRRRLAHGVGQPYYSAWSPTGSQIVSHINGVAGRNAVLRIHDVESLPGPAADETRLALRPGPFQTPAYSPDGSRIAVVLRTSDGSGIHFLDEKGDDLGRLANTRGTVAMSFAPDGSSIAYIDGAYSAIGSAAGPLIVAGAASRRLSDAATAFFWSPDSLKLVFFEPYLARSGGSPELLYRVRLFTRRDGRISTVATMRPASAFAQQVVPFFDQYARAYTIWSTDSRLLALNSLSQSGFDVIHLVDTDILEPSDLIRVRFTAASDSGVLGLLPAEGVRSQPLTFGSTPFFASR